MKKILVSFSSFFALVLPVLAQAHERWFVNDISLLPQKPLLFRMWTTTNASMVLLGIFGLVAALLLHFVLRPRKWARQMRKTLAAFATWVPMILRVATGVLLFSASFQGFLFAPDIQTLDLPANVARVLLAVELLTGLGLFLGIFPRFMSLLGLTLYSIIFFASPIASSLSYISFIGIFAYIFIIGDPSLPKVRSDIKFFPRLGDFLDLDRAKPYAMAAMRMFVGFSFVWVGFYYKLFNPGYALQFLNIHDVNFMPALGFHNFTGDMFVFLAGVTEVVIGLLIFMGLLPRLIGGVLIFLFTLTLAMFGILELLGHLPLYAVAFALLTEGGGKRWSAELGASISPGKT